VESRVKLFGHPIHPMLIVFPLGLFSTASAFDATAAVTGNRSLKTVAFWNIGAGILGGILAALFGALEWLHIPGETRAKRVGLLHGAGNAVVVTLFGASWLLRRGDPADPPRSAYVLSTAALGLATVTGWLGGELVDRLGVGVDRGANLNAPNSLSGEPAETNSAPSGRVGVQ
jgi:uncharacterized membrane protein